MQKGRRNLFNIGALTIRIGVPLNGSYKGTIRVLYRGLHNSFHIGIGGILYYTYKKEPAKPYSNFSGPYITRSGA